MKKKLLLFLLLFFGLSKINNAQSKDSIRFGYAKLSEVTLHYAEAGNGSSMIILLHGFPEFWYCYKNILDEFKGNKQFTALAPDLRGYDLSSKPDSVNAYQLEKLSNDIIELINYKKANSVFLVGHDWGGVIAWNIAILHPEIIQKLIIINAPHPAIFKREIKNNPQQQKASKYIERLKKTSTKNLLVAFHNKALKNIVFGNKEDSVFYNDETKKAYQVAWDQKKAVRSSLNYYKANNFKNIDLPQNTVIEKPVMVLWGMKDEYLLSGNLNGLEQFVPNLKLYKFDDASHWIIHEKPKEVFGLLYQFITN